MSAKLRCEFTQTDVSPKKQKSPKSPKSPQSPKFAELKIFKDEAKRHARAKDKRFIVSLYRVPHGEQMRPKRHLAFSHEIVSPKNGTSKKIDYKLQGNPEFYSKESMEKRKNLFKSKLIFGQILSFWKTHKMKRNSLLPKKSYLRGHMLMAKALDSNFSNSKALITAMHDWRHDCRCKEIVSKHPFDKRNLKKLVKTDPLLEKQLKIQIRERDSEKDMSKSNLKDTQQLSKGGVRKSSFTEPRKDIEPEGLNLWQFRRSMFELADKWTESIDELVYARFLFRLHARITVTLAAGPQKRTWMSLTEVSPLSRKEIIEPLKKVEEDLIYKHGKKAEATWRSSSRSRSRRRSKKRPNTAYKRKKIVVRSRSVPNKGNCSSISKLKSIFQELEKSDNMKLTEAKKMMVLDIVRDISENDDVDAILDPFTKEQALHVVSRMGFVEAVELLLRKNAKPLVEDAKGRTPLYHAEAALQSAKRDEDHQLEAQYYQVIRLLEHAAEKRDVPTNSSSMNSLQKILDASSISEAQTSTSTSMINSLISRTLSSNTDIALNPRNLGGPLTSSFGGAQTIRNRHSRPPLDPSSFVSSSSSSSSSSLASTSATTAATHRMHFKLPTSLKGRRVINTERRAKSSDRILYHTNSDISETGALKGAGRITRPHVFTRKHRGQSDGTYFGGMMVQRLKSNDSLLQQQPRNAASVDPPKRRGRSRGAPPSRSKLRPR